jgi:Ca2+-binding RTX toxin-like protein
MSFTGTADVVNFKNELNTLLIANELGGASPYKLSFAGSITSGFSYGTAQFDLGQGDSTVISTFTNILTNARNAQGNLIIPSSSVSGYLADAKIKGNVNALSPYEKTLINAALSSAYGQTAILAETDLYYDKLIGYVKTVQAADTDPEDQAFLTSKTAQFFICDIINQFGPKAVGWLTNYFGGGSTTSGAVKSGALNVGNVLEWYLQTQQAKTPATGPNAYLGATDLMRRFANVVSQSGGYSPNFSDARLALQAYSQLYLPLESSIYANQNRINNLNSFQNAVTAPADAVIQTWLLSTYGFSYPSGSTYNDVFIGQDNNAKHNTLIIDDGNNIVIAGDGNFSVKGGIGNDMIFAGIGNDSLTAGSGKDTLVGAAGNDTLVGHVGSNDTFVYSGTAPSVSQAPEIDHIIVNGSQGTIDVGNTQLTGPGSSATFKTVSVNNVQNLVWTGGDGTQYQFAPNASFSAFGTLTISNGALGSSGGEIVIPNFNITAAQSSKGYLGLTFTPQVAVEIGSPSDPFTTADATISNGVCTASGVSQTFTIFSS